MAQLATDRSALPLKTLNWYVTPGFLLAFSMAIAILTFGMTGANLVKVLDYVSQGISFWTFLEFTLYILPIILTFTVPWAVMVAGDAGLRADVRRL